MRGSVSQQEMPPLPEGAEISFAVFPEVVGLPLVISVAEMPEDELARLKAEKLIRSVGKVAMSDVETPLDTEQEKQSRYKNLKDAIHAAASGDPTAKKLVNQNMLTEATEIAFKSGNISSIELGWDGENIFQYGQMMQDVFSNAVVFGSGHQAIWERTVPEVCNGMRMTSLLKRGYFEDYCLAVFSRYTDKLSDEEAMECGFFAETKSASIQLTTLNNGRLIQESAFVAGVKHEGDIRHDIDTFVKVGRRLGIDLSGKTDAETINTPLLIHKSLLKDGVLDLVKLYDEAAGSTFFGEAKPQQNYSEYREFCRRREATIHERMQKAVDKLIAEHKSITTPQMAFERLHKLAEAEMVDMAIEDEAINERVFGQEAAVHIEQARYYTAAGNLDKANEHRSEARRTAKSSSCPTMSAKKEGNKDDDDPNDRDTAASEERDFGICVITTRNCYCCALNADGTPGPRRTVKAYFDSEKTLRCMRVNCGAFIRKNGDKDIGNIAKRAKRLEKQAAEEPKDEFVLAG